MNHDWEARAKEWAESNTVPDAKTGRDQEYEVLISIQAQAFEAGAREYYNKAKQQAAVIVQTKSYVTLTVPKSNGVVSAYWENEALDLIARDIRKMEPSDG